MRIAYFNGSIRHGQDGVARVLWRMMEEAQQRGHSVMAFGSAIPETAETCFPIVGVPSFPFPFQPSYRLAFPGYLSFASRLIEFAPDIIHIHSPCTLGFAAMKFGADFDIPVVATYHTHFPTYLHYYNLTTFQPFLMRLLRRLYNSCNTTFVPSRSVIAELRQQGIGGLEYLPNGINLHQFSPSFRSDSLRQQLAPNGETLLLFVGRLVWEKNLRVLGDAWRMLQGRRNDIRMIVVGNGPARSELQELMPEATFVGTQHGKALAEYFATCDLFLFPSVTETFGLVTVEAMASGIVPIAAYATGSADIIQHGINGLLTTPNDPTDLALRTERLIHQPDRRITMAANALQRAKEFGWGRIMDQLFQRYSEIHELHLQRSERIAA